MKKIVITICAIFAVIYYTDAQNNINIDINASKHIGTAKLTFNGTNIEDLNNQTNGGIFSQLIHGEAFEENVDIDFMNLPLRNYVQVHVVLDENHTPHLLSVANSYTRTTWNNLSNKYDFNSRDLLDSYYNAAHPTLAGNSRSDAPAPRVQLLKIGDLNFYGRFVIFDSIPEAYRNILLDRINGKEQISRYWSKIISGSANGVFTLKRGDAYMGRQNQVISHLGGNGDVGVANAGLNKQGINLVAGMPYDGVIRVKSTDAKVIYVSLRDQDGNVLDQKAYGLKADGSYEKVSFELTPDANTPKGKIGISLKSKGEIELGYAFMQPGEWGRINGLPVRKMFADALVKQGITVIRYNGSMVDVGVDTYLYRWKKMIGPFDERRVCYRNGFNPFATHTFGVIELLQVAEAIGAQAMVGLSIDENFQDISDFVEYVNGSTDTPWGALRASHGHPEPYGLKYIQVHNEEPMTVGYAEAMKKFALAAWKVDPEMHIVTSLNIGRRPTSYARGSEQYRLSSELFGWFISHGQGDKMVWDPHFSGSVNFADSPGYENEMGIVLQRELEKDYPGHYLTLCPMEENGSRCDWDRGLAHAHNWNTNQRNADCFTWLGTANTFQPHEQHYMWDQGRVHYTSNEIWFQPSAHIDQMMTDIWLPDVIEAKCSNDTVLDVTAKMNEDKTQLAIYVVNLSDQPKTASINIDGFRYSGKAATWTIGGCELTEFNTVSDKDNVSPIIGAKSMKSKNTQYIFPKYSYTRILLNK